MNSVSDSQVRISLSSASVRAASVAWAAQYAGWHENRVYLQKNNEHYKLLACVASQFKGAHLVDIGTYLGYSALALATGASELGNRVTSYDVADCLPPAPVACVRDVPAVELRVRDASSDLAEISRSAQLIVLDVTPHDGVQERAMISSLIKDGYKGLLVLDDIRLNPDMEALWAWVPLKKLDATALGHWSGTGIVVFDPATADVTIEPDVPVCGRAADGKML